MLIRNYALNTLTVTDELGNAVRYEYNGFGLETRVYDVTGGAELSVKAYDHMLRLLSERGAPGTATAAYGYDALGRVISMASTLYSEAYSYTVSSGLMRTVKAVQGDNESPALSKVSYTDNLGLTTAESAVSGSAEVLYTYAYDYLGRKVSAPNDTLIKLVFAV